MDETLLIPAFSLREKEPFDGLESHSLSLRERVRVRVANNVSSPQNTLTRVCIADASALQTTPSPSREREKKGLLNRICISRRSHSTG